MLQLPIRDRSVIWSILILLQVRAGYVFAANSQPKSGNHTGSRFGYNKLDTIVTYTSPAPRYHSLAHPRSPVV